MQPVDDLRLWQCTDELVDHLAIDEEFYIWNAANVVLTGDILMIFSVQLG